LVDDLVAGALRAFTRSSKPLASDTLEYSLLLPTSVPLQIWTEVGVAGTIAASCPSLPGSVSQHGSLSVVGLTEVGGGCHVPAAYDAAAWARRLAVLMNVPFEDPEQWFPGTPTQSMPSG
jgi:hypothetical protein